MPDSNAVIKIKTTLRAPMAIKKTTARPQCWCA